MSKTPIEQWYSLIQSDLSDLDLSYALRNIYKEFHPVLAELIVESYCPAQCQHCIYPPDYHKHNEVLTEQQWENILYNLYTDLNFRTYIFGGRYLTKKILHAVSYIKKNFSDAEVGLIADARHLEAMLDDVIKLKPDWIDISIDGLALDHDSQRRKPGAFNQALRVINELKRLSSAPKVNILPCLTKINLSSVTNLIDLLNSQGFKNFFISPVTIVENLRPAQDLALTSEDFVRFIDNLIARSVMLTDSWIEINIYDVRYYYSIKQLRPELFSNFTLNNDHLEYVINVGDNEMHINYYPMSLTGVNELIINSNGDIIPPTVVAMGKIAEDLIFGNMLEFENDDIFFEKLALKKGFSFYLAELLQEKGVLRTY